MRSSSSTECISTNSRTALVVNLSTFSWSFLYFATTFQMIPSRLGATLCIIPCWYLLLNALPCFTNSAESRTLMSQSGWNDFGWCINFGINFGTWLINHVSNFSLLPNRRVVGGKRGGGGGGWLENYPKFKRLFWYLSKIFLVFIYSKWVYILKPFVGGKFSQNVIARAGGGGLE